LGVDILALRQMKVFPSPIKAGNSFDRGTCDS